MWKGPPIFSASTTLYLSDLSRPFSPLSPFAPPSTATWVIIFLSCLSFKLLFLLSITWWSFRSLAWSNTPQRFTWNRGHAQLIHHFPFPPAPPISPVFIHSRSSLFSFMLCLPPLSPPHFLALSHSFITGETPQWTSICTTHPLHIYSILTATFKAACSIQYIFSASISQYIKYCKVTLWSK